MIAKPLGVGPLSPPQPVNPRKPSTEILERMTAEKIILIKVLRFIKIVSCYVRSAASRSGGTIVREQLPEVPTTKVVGETMLSAPCLKAAPQAEQKHE